MQCVCASCGAKKFKFTKRKQYNILTYEDVLRQGKE